MNAPKALFDGPRVRLTAIAENDHSTIAGWSDDSEYLRNLRTAAALPESPAKVTRFAELDRGDSRRFSFAIRLKASADIVGIAVIKDSEWPNRSGWLALGIGDAGLRGQGLGSEALGVLLDFAFDELNLRRLSLTVMSYNEGAVKLYLRHGFVEEGVLRSAIERDGSRFDLLVLGLLADERTDARSASGHSSS